MVEAWGKAFKIHARGRGDECIVCGRKVPATAFLVTASPATGKFVPAAIVGTPAGDAIEASVYPVGPDCAKAVRAAFPESFPPDEHRRAVARMTTDELYKALTDET